MRTQGLLFFFVVLIFFIFTGCDDNTQQIINELTFPEKNVSYSEHVQTLFNVRCNYVHCHGSTVASKLMLVSYYEATRYPGIIVKGMPDNSILNQRLEGRLRPMPPIGDPLSPNFINGVRTWVKEGGNNN